MYKFGNLLINGKVALAPMAGYTSSGYREFMNPFGVSLCYTEMVSDMGLIYGNKETKSYVLFNKTDVPTGVQLFGNDPKTLCEALLICEQLNPNISFYDINMGCPVNKVTKAGSGSALLKNPKMCGEIIRSLKTITSKPISAKIRLGWDKNSINFLEVIDELEKGGVDLIALHARTTKELYTGKPHYELIRDLRKKMTVPLLISGDIYTVDDALNAINITGADGVMVARGGIGNPVLITNINKVINGEEFINVSLTEQIENCKNLAKKLIEEKGENIAMRVFRSMSSKFLCSFPDSKRVRSRLASEVTTYQELLNILDDYQKSFQQKI